jgi:hypothetical protein
MKLEIKRQDKYSRGELLLRTFFGLFYIAIPHFFLMMFVGIWSAILGFLAWWVILFTGKYPKSWFEFQVKFANWGTRVGASMSNLVDGYPAFFPSGKSDKVDLSLEYPETLSRGKLILRTLFGIIYVYIPHGFCLYFRLIGTAVLMLLAWFVVLFTGKYPEKWHAFNVGTSRWGQRVGFYMANMTDDYPPFSGKA